MSYEEAAMLIRNREPNISKHRMVKLLLEMTEDEDANSFDRVELQKKAQRAWEDTGFLKVNRN